MWKLRVCRKNLGKNVFKDFRIGNTVRYKQDVGIAMFWHKIKSWRFVLCVLSEFSAWNRLVLHDSISLAEK